MTISAEKASIILLLHVLPLLNVYNKDLGA